MAFNAVLMLFWAAVVVVVPWLGRTADAFRTGHFRRRVGLTHSQSSKVHSTPVSVEDVDNEYSLANSTWLRIFDEQQRPAVAAAALSSSEAAYVAPVVALSSWLPNTRTWRSYFPSTTEPGIADEPPLPPAAAAVAETDQALTVVPELPLDKEAPPPTLQEYLRGDKALNSQQEENIQSLWAAMKNRGSLRHLSGDCVYMVIEALRVAYVALWGKHTIRTFAVSVSRARGTAAILGELKADVDVVLSGILYDVFAQLSSDPTLMNVEARRQLRLRFGDEVVELCDRYNRLPVFMSKKADYTPIQSENQLQMLVAVAEDYRALYMRLADRLDTLRTLRSLPLSEKERVKLAQEALNVYAPLAHRMGVMKVKGELEDLAFKFINPDMFQRTKYTQIAANKAYHEAFDAVKHIMERDPYLKSQGAKCKLIYRIKDKYQLNLKMVRKNLSSMNQVRDALGMRIIVDYARIKGEGESEESYAERGNAICYHLIRELRGVPGWVPAEHGFKDYVKSPKDNGYRSLHQYMRHVALGTNVEIQVRTRAMHVQAELGEAAHWAYKDSIYRAEIATTKVYRQAWRSPQQLQAKSPAELLGMARQQLAASRVFVFLDDRSTVLNLPKGATALDAAFALHSDVGLTLAKVCVSGHEAPLDRVLLTGDVLSCACAPDGLVTVKPTWLGIVKTTNAQGTIRKYYRDHNKGMLACIGCVQLLMVMTLSAAAVKKRFPQSLPDADKMARWAIKRSQLRDISELLVKLGASSKAETASLVGGLLDIPAANLTVSSISLALMWARMQGRNGWEEREVQRSILIPLMTEVLPPLLGGRNGTVEALWGDLVGARTLLEEDEPDALMTLPQLSQPFHVPADVVPGHELDFSWQYVISPPKAPQATVPARVWAQSVQADAALDYIPVTGRRERSGAVPKGTIVLGQDTQKRMPRGQVSAAPHGKKPDVATTEKDTANVLLSSFTQLATPSPLPRQSLNRKKSPIVSLLRRPYALEAPSLSVPLLKLARKTYGERENEKRENEKCKTRLFE